MLQARIFLFAIQSFRIKCHFLHQLRAYYIAKNFTCISHALLMIIFFTDEKLEHREVKWSPQDHPAGNTSSRAGI